jgi:hypothetical protein
MNPKYPRTIGLETSSIMPLAELTPRTRPLQDAISEVGDVMFVTDRNSLEEAEEQIKKSYENALLSVDKTESVIKREEITDAERVKLIFVKALAETYWGGREETLRWADAVLIREKVRGATEFIKILKTNLDAKFASYLNVFHAGPDKVWFRSSEIKAYWATPELRSDLDVQVRVIPNSKKHGELYELLQPLINSYYEENITMNDIKDLYHLYSLYYGADVREVWSCNQRFVKIHAKYLSGIPNKEFSDMFKNTKIARIK